MPRIIFERYHSGYFMPFAMRNPRRFFFFGGGGCGKGLADMVKTAYIKNT